MDNKAYKDADLVSIKTTLNLPYYTGSAHYERAYGTIEVKGITYQYVKRRVYQDTLELLCLPNNAIKQIKETRNNIARQSTDGSAQSPVNKDAGWSKIALPDLFSQTIITCTPASFISGCTYATTPDARLSTGHLSAPDRPPRSLQCPS